jgi:hypothetical protein
VPPPGWFMRPSTPETAPSEPGLFHHRDFRLLIAGQTTSQLGTQVSGIAMSLVAVVTLHATAFEVGLIGTASTLAFVTMGALPFGGLAGGTLDLLGARATLWIVAPLLALAFLPLVGPLWRIRDVTDLPAAKS